MMTKIIAGDLGFNSTKIVSGSTKYMFASVLGQPTNLLTSFRTEFGRNGQADDTSFVLEINDQPRLIGSQVYRLSELEPQRHEAPDWVFSDAYRYLLTGALLLAGRGSFQVRFVTGLPLAYYQRQRAGLKKMLLGAHSGKIVEPDRQSQSVTIIEAGIIPQGLGVFFCRALKPGGELAGDEWAEGRYAVIDGGGGTFNLATVDRLDMVETAGENRSLEIGGNRVIAHIRQQLLAQHPNRRKSIRAGVIEQAIQQRTRLGGKGFEGDLRRAIDQALDLHYEPIITAARSMWRDGSDLDGIILGGGGSLMFADRLLEDFGGKAMPATGDLAEMVYANAIGYYRLGRMQFGG